MFAAQSRKADQTRSIELLARESEFPIDEVAHLYEDALAELGTGARITSFLHIFALRNVREALRKRNAAAHPLVVPPAYVGHRTDADSPPT